NGRNLARQKLQFPDDFAGDVNLVFIAFQQWQQMEVDSWVSLAEELCQTYPGLAYYEFPTIRRLNRLSQMFINEGMRAGIPNPATRQRTITLYLNKNAFRQALDINNEDHIWLYLFDQAGRVLWRLQGAYTVENGEALETAVAAAFS
ncbi:MAG: hypothetical protein P8183_20065, partial [Anaerolineae bacterium]